jgi:hypothetical protein
MPVVPPSLAAKRHDPAGFDDAIRRSSHAEKNGFPNLHYGNPLRQQAAGGDGDGTGSYAGVFSGPSGSATARARAVQDNAPHPRRIVANPAQHLSLNLSGLPHPPPLKVPHPPRKGSGGDGVGNITARASPSVHGLPDRHKQEPAHPLTSRATNMRMADPTKLKSWASEAILAPTQPLTARAPVRTATGPNQDEAGAKVNASQGHHPLRDEQTWSDGPLRGGAAIGVALS